MNLTNRFNAFLISINKLLLQILSKFDPQLPRPTPPCDDAVNLEAPPQPAGFVVEHCKKDWTETMVVFCLKSAIAIALPPPSSPLTTPNISALALCSNFTLLHLLLC